MIQEEKQLLLTDLCGRLPYGVKISAPDGNQTLVGNICTNGGGKVYTTNMLYNISQVKPYLRPMSCMTEEERKKYAKLLFADLGGVYEDYYKALDYLHSIHVDYRGLIPKGLALEAPDGMYGKEEQQ